MVVASDLLYSFLVDGTEVLSYVLANSKIEQKNINTSGNYAHIELDINVLNVLVPVNGMTVVVSRGVSTSTDYYEFRGFIENVSYPDPNRVIIDCKDNLEYLKNDFFTTSYDKNVDSEAGEPSAIFSDIVSNSTAGLTASVVSSGTGATDIVLDKFISRDNSRLNRLDLIAKILNWVFYYDYDNDYVRLEPRGYITYPTNLVVGTNVYNVPRWDVDMKTLFNKIKVKGAFQLDTRQENEIGDGVTATFNFSFEPESTECTVDGNLQVRGITGSSSTFDYSVDKELKTYTFEAGSIPGAVAIVMNYTTRIPAPVIVSDPDSISTYNITRMKVYEFDDIVTVTDAETRANQLLQLFKDPEVSTTLHTDEYTLKPGNKVVVEDPNNSRFNGEYIILSKIINYPEPLDVVKIGTDRYDISELFDTINSRLSALEMKDITSSELLRVVVAPTRTTTLKRRYATILRRDVSSVTNAIIWDDLRLGRWGDDMMWGDESEFPAQTTSWLRFFNNTYEEYFDDEVFSGSGTATWNTTDYKLSFTSGQTRTTGLFSIGVAHTFFTVSLGSVTGTLTVEISGDDGSNWQTVTLDSRTAFSVSAISGVKLRITESGASTASISTVTDNTGKFITPGISVLLED